MNEEHITIVKPNFHEKFLQFAEWQRKINKIANYESLDQFAREEGIEAVLDFLSRSPEQSKGFYLDTKMKVVKYSINKL